MCKIVSIHSFRGGTGKSNMVANVAATMAQQGQKVGIIDTDLQSPGIHVIFGLDEDQINLSLNDYLWGKCNIQEAAYDVTCVFNSEPVDGELYLIPSSIKAGEISRVLREGYDVGRLNDGFQELIRCLKLDYLLIDTHPGLNEETLLSIAISDVLVVIFRPDSQDFQGTAVTVDVARKLQVPKMLLVVNKVLSAYDFAALITKVQRSYKTDVAGIIPLSEDIIQLASSDVFCLRHPDHFFSQTIREISQQIASKPEAVLAGEIK
ncbi:MinD/ParA family protein [Pleurocapsa sp. PCC 7319]|uniref:MinD/ParA family ATP-binding protein n=1 Tax=Pleurocapsa sp. PCC 7319 TaxID=118161 RepID=UPI000345DC63|nr:MinD/ParA family protein [Pleurocapsa sp. PCC 7319]